MDENGTQPVALLLRNAIDWANGNDELIPRRTTGLTLNTLDKTTKAKRDAIRAVNLYGLPALVALAGLVVWRLRVARRRASANLCGRRDTKRRSTGADRTTNGRLHNDEACAAQNITPARSLAVAYIADRSDGRSGARTLKAEGIDSLVVENPTAVPIRFRRPATFTVGSADGSTDRVPADQAKAAAFASALESVRVLGVVSSGGDAVRFGFAESRDGGSAAANLQITASAKGKKVRTLVAGKAASVPSQTYVRADGSSDVLLVSGDYLARFNIALDDLKQKDAPPPTVDAVGAADTAGEAALQTQ